MIVRLSGGLGNQMFQYAMGRAVSEAKGEKLYIDKTGFKGENRVFALGIYPIVASELKGIKKGYYWGLYHIFRKTYLERGKKCGLGVCHGLNTFVYEDLAKKREKYYDGCWQNIRYFEKIGKNIRKELDGGEIVTEKVDVLLQQIINTNAVAVHVRHGDYFNEHNQRIYAVPTEYYYESAISYMREHLMTPVFYIFSDDIDWCRKQFCGKKDCIIVEDYLKRIGVEERVDPNSSQEDLYLMQSCKHHIIANSSFSWWAAYLGKKEESIQIAPARWFFNGENENVKEALLKDFMLISEDEKILKTNKW